MSVTGPSHFAEITGLTFTPITYSTGSSSAAAIPVYSVSGVRINQNVSIVYGMDNNKKRPVSAHAASESQNVTVSFNDIKAFTLLQAYKGAIGTITFTWKASTSQLTTSPLADQTVTIHNVCVNSVDADPASKGLGSATLSGSLMEMADDSDPITFA